MACLVGRQLDEAVGQDNRSSCVEPEAGSGGGCFGEPPVRREGDEQASLVSSPEVGDIYSVGTDFCFRMPDLRRLDEEADELMGSNVPTIRGTPECTSVKNADQGSARGIYGRSLLDGCPCYEH